MLLLDGGHNLFELGSQGVPKLPLATFGCSLDHLEVRLGLPERSLGYGQLVTAPPTGTQRTHGELPCRQPDLGKGLSLLSFAVAPNMAIGLKQP